MIGQTVKHTHIHSKTHFNYHHTFSADKISTTGVIRITANFSEHISTTIATFEDHASLRTFHMIYDVYGARGWKV